LRRFDSGTRDLFGRHGIVVSLAANHALIIERLQTLDVAATLREASIGARQIGVGSRESGFKRAGVDGEQTLPSLGLDCLQCSSIFSGYR
jgi:hypothetical protein